MRIDLYGYGESDGKFEDITITTAKESVLGAVKFAKENIKYKGLYLFGTSYGGSGILAATPILSPTDIAGLILRCTILNYLKKTQRDYTSEELKDWKENGFIDDTEGKLNYSFVEDMNNHKEIDISSLSKFNTIYFHAGKDTKVLRSEVNDLKEKIGEKFKLVVYPNSVHGIDIPEDFDDMLVKTKEFILNKGV